MVWKVECSCVKNGGFPDSANTLFSTMVHSTSSSWITTSFFRIFTAYKSSVPLRSASITYREEKRGKMGNTGKVNLWTIRFFMANGSCHVLIPTSHVVRKKDAERKRNKEGEEGREMWVRLRGCCTRQVYRKASPTVLVLAVKVKRQSKYKRENGFINL